MILYARSSDFLEEDHLCLKEDMSPDERAARAKGWPLVKKLNREVQIMFKL